MRIPAAGALALALAGCAAPISTLPSPVHPRTIELRNDTDEPRLLFIEPTDPSLQGATFTFTGVLRPGEVKVLYLYHGYTYRFRIVDSRSPGAELDQDVQVDEDLALAYEGDALTREAMAGAPGEPRVLALQRAEALDAREVVRARLGEPDLRVARTLDPELEDGDFSQRTAETAFQLPYEVWTYLGSGYKYVFLDEFRSGRYVLVHSSDPQEPARPDWQARLSEAAVAQILREF
ncbi:MAG TPA: hypothetical protein VIC56_00735 [Gemmatimonadota bacterium]